jgi:hypothetical protein
MLDAADKKRIVSWKSAVWPLYIHEVYHLAYEDAGLFAASYPNLRFRSGTPVLERTIKEKFERDTNKEARMRNGIAVCCQSANAGKGLRIVDWNGSFDGPIPPRRNYLYRGDQPATNVTADLDGTLRIMNPGGVDGTLHVRNPAGEWEMVGKATVDLNTKQKQPAIADMSSLPKIRNAAGMFANCATVATIPTSLLNLPQASSSGPILSSTIKPVEVDYAAMESRIASKISAEQKENLQKVIKQFTEENPDMVRDYLQVLSNVENVMAKSGLTQEQRDELLEQLLLERNNPSLTKRVASATVSAAAGVGMWTLRETWNAVRKIVIYGGIALATYKGYSMYQDGSFARVGKVWHAIIDPIEDVK